MSDYTQLTYFAVKDSLTSGDTEKIVYGSDYDEEFSRINVAIASKVDEPVGPSTNDVLTWNGSAVAWQAGSVMPPGSVVPYAGTVGGEPTGWLFCDGRSLAQVGTYAALYAAISTSYGNSAGGANFDLPDLRFRVPVGLDDMGTAKGAASRSSGVTYASGTGLEGSTGGAATQTLSTANLAAHTHALVSDRVGGNASIDFDTGMYRNQQNSAGAGTDMWNASASGTLQDLTISGATELAGSGTPFERMQPFIALNYIIKY